MDIGRQLYESQAEGWARGIYEDIKQTFRSPVVNWIFRTLMANHPEFLRHAWGQCKPVLQTAACLDACECYRAAVRKALDASGVLFRLNAADLGLAEAELLQLRGQLATFNRVAPLLAIWYELLHRGLHELPVGQAFDISNPASTAPAGYPAHKEICLPPVALSPAEVPKSLVQVAGSISRHHAMPGRLATVHLCLAKWPGFLAAAWAELLPVLASDAYERARLNAVSAVKRLVDRVPYCPVLDSRSLRALGFAAGDLADIRSAVDYFYSGGPAETVIPTLPLFAALAGAGGAAG